MTDKLPDELHCQAEVEVREVGKTDLEVRMGKITVRDGNGNLIRTIPRPPRRRFGDGAQTR